MTKLSFCLTVSFCVHEIRHGEGSQKYTCIYYIERLEDGFYRLHWENILSREKKKTGVTLLKKVSYNSIMHN